MVDEIARAALEIALNCLWQGTLVAVGAWGVARVLGLESAATRYVVWAAALAAFVVLPLATAASRTTGGPPPSPSVGRAVAGVGVDESHAQIEPAAGVAQPPARHPVVELDAGRWPLWALAALSLVWVLRFGRLAAGTFAIARMRRRCRPISAERAAALRRWTVALDRGRRAMLASSPDARTPMVLGLGRPIVAIPAALVEVLSDDELDQVALHELAHVRRRDDWAKLAQSAAEALCAFHPAARWIARRVDAEREVACDDWVISVTRERRRYARCLLKLAGFGLASASVPAPGAVGRKPLISERIELVMQTNRNAQPKPSNLSRLSVVAALLVAAALCVASGPAVALTGRAVVDQPPAGGPRGAAPHSGPEPTVAAPRGAPETSDAWLRAEAAAAIVRDDARDETQFVRFQATQALGDRPGAVLVMKAKTGEVVAAVNQEWIFRRGFPPASTIKLVTALAGLEAGTLDPDERVAAHGARVDLDHALALSNNDYFRRVGQRVRYARFRAVARELGLGEPTLADFGGEYPGVLPDDEPSDVFATGEGIEVTPAQLATLVAALGNGGLLLAPRMPHGVDVAPTIRRRVDLDAEDVRRLLPGMLGAVRYGTATGAAIGTIDVAGKTGTADGPELGTGLFVSFAPAEDPEYVVVVVLRGKGAMGAQAAAVAGQVYRAILGC